MVTENTDNIDAVVEETPKKTKAKKPKYDAVQKLPEVYSDMQQYVFTMNIIGGDEDKQVVASSESAAANLLGLTRDQVVFGSQVDYKG
ncbi:MAG: hypothetical protein CMB80_02955 [Flammeovirgaceae bacterium]|nr:hypothetical protein [Flammeovirgaceae bacterium]|tara:strand:+ start:196 stop:459 length:264 start_codon:yes stop_codon:yes gene_type:complete